MNLFDLTLLIIICLLGGMFWRFRATSEAVKAHLDTYCEKQQLQLISVARIKIRLASYKGKLDFKTEFAFEFSGNGEDSYQGRIHMIGLKVLDIDTPAYRVD